MDDPPLYDAPADLDVSDEDRALDTLIPDGANQPYDIKDVVTASSTTVSSSR